MEMARPRLQNATYLLPREALRWTQQGKRNRGRPKETWRRTVNRELKNRGLTLQTAPATAADRPKWRSLAVASSTRWHRGDRVRVRFFS
ncbi:hypothetical protein DPMN_099957 [Dreissena polymorpha]|uniref:Uncharacterized protein n=1 Tax=Dreissena polymorpha TaxID=45954 RepID=A0A9D4LFV4_DREPO|nr:hypothetical protein DPMN_099957 [Dreissena polymorpha]